MRFCPACEEPLEKCSDEEEKDVITRVLQCPECHNLFEQEFRAIKWKEL